LNAESNNNLACRSWQDQTPVLSPDFHIKANRFTRQGKGMSPNLAYVEIPDSMPVPEIIAGTGKNKQAGFSVLGRSGDRRSRRIDFFMSVP
jgi:hypothetical protein